MPTLLAIESSTDACSAAICCDHIIQESFVIRPREHNKILLPMINELLNGLQLTIADLDAIAFGAGPGSFTGLRLAAGIVQGLAFASQKPVIAISTLATLALAAGEQANTAAPQIILVALDARMQDIYFGAYHYEQGNLQALCEDQLLPFSELGKTLAQLDVPLTSIKIGDGWPEETASATDKAPIKNIYPHARTVLTLAIKQFHTGELLTAEQALPVYLRETISWQKWQPKRALKQRPTTS